MLASFACLSALDTHTKSLERSGKNDNESLNYFLNYFSGIIAASLNEINPHFHVALFLSMFPKGVGFLSSSAQL